MTQLRSQNRGASTPLAGVWMLVLASLLLSGCSRDDIEVYYIPKEDPWKKPAGWQEREAGGMRAARFSAPSASGSEIDVSIIPIPRGFSGSHVEIINIWRQQMQLEPVQSDTDAGRLSEKVFVGTLEAELYEMTSAGNALDGKLKAKTVVAAVKKDGASWFIKMTGDEAGVDQQKPAFVAFLKSINLNNIIPPSAPATAASGDPHSGGAGGHEGHEHAHDHASHPEWEVPAGWTEQAPTQMLNAKFAIAGDGGARADVNISVLSGDGGGLRENVNRWRKQVGLDPWDDAALEKNIVTIDAGGRKAMIVDIQGKDPRNGEPSRLIGAIVPHQGQTWFYKLMGNEQLAGRQKEAFLKFVNSAKYPNTNPNG